MSLTVHYIDGQESALEKIGFAGLDADALKILGLRAGGGAALGAGLGAASAGEGNRLEGGAVGALAGGAAGGAASYGLNRVGDGLAQLAAMGNPRKFKQLEAIQQAARRHALEDPGSLMAGGAAFGSVPALAAGTAMRDDNEKVGFLGFTPEEVAHIAMRTGGGTAAGAGIGAIAGGEDNRLQGALLGGAAGGLSAGGLSMGRKAMSPGFYGPHAADMKATAAGTMGGGGLLGAAPALLAGRAARED